MLLAHLSSRETWRAILLPELLGRRGLAAMALLLLGFIPAEAAPTFASGVSQGMVTMPELGEASGIVASRNNSGVLWTHNDSGDSARIFAIDIHGRKLGIYNLPGGVNVDYEDIAMGPGPVTNVLYLYVGDIGDNVGSRSNVRVYQIPEPAVYSSQFASPFTSNLKGVRALTFTYPDGPHDAEAMFVDPRTGDLFIVAKHANPAKVYTASKTQLDAGNTNQLALAGSVSFDSASGADISADGSEIIIRQEDFARLWKRAPGQSVMGALAGLPVSIPVVGRPIEINGEAIGFDQAGAGYFTLSDSTNNQPLYHFQRVTPDSPEPLQEIVAAGSTWKYLDNGSDQGMSWRQPSFDDVAWKSGEGPFGYGNGHEQTVIGFGTSPENKYITTYFRTSFVLENAPCIGSLIIKMLNKDGAAFYLEWFRFSNFKLARTRLTTPLAFAAAPTSLEDTWRSFQLDSAFLVNGTSTIAVEVHRANVTNASLVFDCQIYGLPSGNSVITDVALTNNQFQLALCGPSTSNVTVQASDDLANWTNLATVTLTNGVGRFVDEAPDPRQRFYRLRQ